MLHKCFQLVTSHPLYFSPRQCQCIFGSSSQLHFYSQFPTGNADEIIIKHNIMSYNNSVSGKFKQFIKYFVQWSPLTLQFLFCNACQFCISIGISPSIWISIENSSVTVPASIFNAPTSIISSFSGDVPVVSISSTTKPS